MNDAITSGKEVIAHIERGWELWHVSDSPLPGHWELRKARERTQQVHWDAIETIRRHYLRWFEKNTVHSEEGRYETCCYRFRQASLVGIA
jgi:hypothetical protein